MSLPSGKRVRRRWPVRRDRMVLYSQHEVLVDRTDDEDPGKTASPLPRCCNLASILQNSLMANLRDYRSYDDSGAMVYIVDFMD